MKATYRDIALLVSGDNIHMRVLRRAGKPDPLILLVAREPLLRASVRASVSLSSPSQVFLHSINYLSLPQICYAISFLDLYNLSWSHSCGDDFYASAQGSHRT